MRKYIKIFKYVFNSRNYFYFTFKIFVEPLTIERLECAKIYSNDKFLLKTISIIINRKISHFKKRNFSKICSENFPYGIIETLFKCKKIFY